MSKGKLIIIEGIDGAGKSAQVNALLKIFRKRGIPAIATREPGGTPIGEDIRTIIKKDYSNNQKTSLTELLLFFASRAANIAKLKEILDSGISVVMDRFYLSSLAYQGAGLGLKDETEALCHMVLGDLRPDLQVIIDIPIELGLERSLQRDGTHDIIESRGLDFFTKIRDCFVHYSQVNDPLVPNCLMINGDRSMDEVSEVIETVCDDYGVFSKMSTATIESKITDTFGGRGVVERI